MKSYRYLQLDVFTEHLFGGNQLAVFLDARGLATSTMQAIAREMNFSETTFALPRSGVITPDREQFIFGLGVGPVPVSLTWRSDELSFAWMTQPLPAFSAPTIGAAEAAAALGL